MMTSPSTVTQIYFITMSLGFSCHNKYDTNTVPTTRKTNIKGSRIKSLTKANTDHQNGEIKQNFFSNKPQLIRRYITEIKSNWLVISEAGRKKSSVI